VVLVILLLLQHRHQAATGSRRVGGSSSRSSSKGDCEAGSMVASRAPGLLGGIRVEESGEREEAG
jgi:hypothetical protein